MPGLYYDQFQVGLESLRALVSVQAGRASHRRTQPVKHVDQKPPIDLVRRPDPRLALG